MVLLALVILARNEGVDLNSGFSECRSHPHCRHHDVSSSRRTKSFGICGRDIYGFGSVEFIPREVVSNTGTNALTDRGDRALPFRVEIYESTTLVAVTSCRSHLKAQLAERRENLVTARVTTDRSQKEAVTCPLSDLDSRHRTATGWLLPGLVGMDDVTLLGNLIDQGKFRPFHMSDDRDSHAWRLFRYETVDHSVGQLGEHHSGERADDRVTRVMNAGVNPGVGDHRG